MTAKKTTKGLLGVLVSNNAWKGLADNTPHYRLKLLAEANKEEN
ncbi:hypothetical protein [Thalassobacillus sp. C254]|nr:hypothetical protein [Thalassobacillus sp. C254]